MKYNINDVVVEEDDNGILAFYVVVSVRNFSYPYQTRLLHRVNNERQSTMVSFAEDATSVRFPTKLEMLLYGL